MKYYSTKSIAARLLQAEEAILIGQTNPELSESLVIGGYTDTAFAEGMALVTAVRDVDTRRREQLGTQVVATSALKAALRNLRSSFDTDRRIARQVLRGMDDLIDLLRLKEKTSSTTEELMLQVRHFYKKLQENTEVMTLMQARYNITVELLDARLLEVVAAEEAWRTQQYLKGEMREMTRQRRAAMDAVDTWMRRFNTTARLLFKDDVPKLDKLGIHVRRVSVGPVVPVEEVAVPEEDSTVEVSEE